MKSVEYNSEEILLWSLYDTQAVKNTWNHGQVYIFAQDTYKVYFEQYAGTDSKQFVGLDDISMVVSSACIFIPPDAHPLVSETTQNPIPETTTPDTSIKELDCDFETPSCLWYNNPNNTNTNWTTIKASDTLNIHAPLVDHTLSTNQGYYLSLETDSYFSKTNVLLSSPLMNGTKCVAFWLVKSLLLKRFWS